MRSFLAVALVVLAAAPAVAEVAPDPDPAAKQAANANLESTSRRKGTSFTFALGTGLTIGLGIEDAVGGGGSFSLRLAHVATEDALLTFEISGVVLLHKLETTMVNDKENRNDDSNFLAGGMLYINRALWVRAAVGFGVYKGRNVGIGDGMVGNVTLFGPAGLVGGGIDLVRLDHLELGLELMSISMLNREGILSSNAMMLGFSVD
ncbi:MAG: hypothetical protein ABI867_05140 [Kofleriaceae bacterium]